MLSSDLHTYPVAYMCPLIVNTKYIKCKSFRAWKKRVPNTCWNVEIFEVEHSPRQGLKSPFRGDKRGEHWKSHLETKLSIVVLLALTYTAHLFVSQDFFRIICLKNGILTFKIFHAALSTVNQIFSASELPWRTKVALWEAPIILVAY